MTSISVPGGQSKTRVSPEALSRNGVLLILGITVLVALAVYYFVGVATGIIAFSAAMGALVAVAYLVLHGRFKIRPRNLAWMIAGFGFLGVYLLPFVKYSAVAFLVVYGVLIGLMPSLGDLPANVAASDQFGYARAATETPQPIVNILSTPLVVDGKTIAPGQILYPGFDADVLWKFRWYSIINQALIWLTVALVFGALLERFLGEPARRDSVTGSAPEPVPTASGQP